MVPRSIRPYKDRDEWAFLYEKAEAARSECEGDGAPDVEAFFASAGRREATDHSCRWSWITQKAEAARSECEGDGAPDVEAFFASLEGAKPPIILAAGAGLHKKRRRLALIYFTRPSKYIHI